PCSPPCVWSWPRPAAAAAHAVGVSAALGAFLAGMVLGESDVRHHMENHLKPFRDVLSGVFFVTVGLQLDGAQILSAPLTVLACWQCWCRSRSCSIPWPCGRRACPPSMPGARA